MKKAFRVLVIIIILAACVGLGAYLAVNRRAPAPSAKPPASPHQAQVAPAPKRVKVYRVVIENNQPKLRAIEKEVPAGENPAEIALRHLIEEGDNAGLANPIPRGTRLLGLEIKDGLATVNLSREFSDNFSGGSEGEGLVVGVILRTLGQFPEIERVRLLVEGRPLETLGHLDLSGEMDVHWRASENGGNN